MNLKKITKNGEQARLQKVNGEDLNRAHLDFKKKYLLLEIIISPIKRKL